MRRTLATFALLALAFPGAALADAPGPTGMSCGITTTSDPNGWPGDQTGVIRGGPITVPGAQAVEVYCEVRFHPEDDSDAHAFACWVDGEVGQFCAPGPVSFNLGGHDLYYLCTEVRWWPGGYAEECDLATYSAIGDVYEVPQRPFPG